MNLTPLSTVSALPFAKTLYETVGGAPVFERIIARFYDGIESDALLRPMYPDDLGESRRTMTLFLIQFFGGPDTYSQERGHPRLRMRHLPFVIGQAERDAWMSHMTKAVQAENFAPEIESTMLDYFNRTATFMMNK